MNGEAGLKCINKNYRKDGKGSVNIQPFPSFAEMFLKLNKNLQLTLDETVFIGGEVKISYGFIVFSCG